MNNSSLTMVSDHVWFCFLVIIQLLFLFHINGCSGCLQREKVALLTIKSYINSPVSPDSYLPSWDSSDEESDCCGWEGIECSRGTGRVVKLLIGGMRWHWPFSWSLFLPFEELSYLDLSSCYISRWISKKGFETLSVLSNLETLLLDSNYFDNSILPSLRVLSSVKTLSLAVNRLSGSIDIGASHNKSNLEDLDLGYNDITEIRGFRSLSKLKSLRLRSIRLSTDILKSLNALKSLKTLDIGGNDLLTIDTRNGFSGLQQIQELDLTGGRINTSFLYDIRVLPSLKVLTLWSTGLDGSLPDQGWCELSNLQELDLSENDLEGTLPSCLRNLTSIKFLDLSQNHFTETLVRSPISDLKTLEYLFLQNNDMEIPNSFAPLFNHSNLKVLLVGGNILSDQIETPTHSPRFQLTVFSLLNIRSNSLHNHIELPPFLYSQYNLREIDLSNNGLVGPFPYWLLQNNTKLKDLIMRNNSLVGPFTLPSRPHLHAKYIDISKNYLEGQARENLGFIFPNLEALNISNNLLDGHMPASLGNMRSLRLLDFSYNNLTGKIPESLASGCFDLQLLRLSNNNLQGQVFSSFANLTSLSWLYLDNNHFTGEIPPDLSSFGFTLMDISNNHFSGKLPSWLRNMSELRAIALYSNDLEGPITTDFCQLVKLEFLDLSDNNFSGPIPACFTRLTRLRHAHLSRNRLNGPITHAFYNSSSLVTLDLSENEISGSIPNWIGKFPKLSVLLLKRNKLEGEIPVQICRLKELSILDLSQNNLSGSIPVCFTDIRFERISGKSYVSDGMLSWNTITDLDFSKGPDSVVKYFYGDSYNFLFLDVLQQVEFTTKHSSLSYRGKILQEMSGIDLSCNNLTGEIPPEIGNLMNIYALNLSHNNLSGTIPETFAHLRQIESLDLSYNSLDGRIPPELVELGFLAVFSVAENNLSGPTPDQKGQFATFGEGSYEGNPLLCGHPLHIKCTGSLTEETAPDKEGDGFSDMRDFYASFLASYVVVVAAMAAVLFINPRWRQAWFHFIEVCITFPYYLVANNSQRRLNRRRM